ncbi:MAG: hypothetical protein PHG36_07385 [Dehalococcoidia bacterium]|nr:hypothetical protein [Dehalococcoidia bacterium]
MAFNIHLAGEEQVIDNGSYLPFPLILMESGSLIIKAIRMITASPAFRSLLSGLIRQQAGELFDVIDYYKHIGDIYRTYPSAASLLKKALIIEQGGITLPGEPFK